MTERMSVKNLSGICVIIFAAISFVVLSDKDVDAGEIFHCQLLNTSEILDSYIFNAVHIVWWSFVFTRCTNAKIRKIY